MKAIHAKFKEFCQSEGGPTTVEYAVMLAVVAVIGVGTKEAFQEFSDEYDTAIGG